MADPAHCALVSSFVARQLVILLAGLCFLFYTCVRVRQGKETRDVRTLAADVSKQAGQQAIGGALMVAVGVLLAEDDLDALAWYGAEYPFEIIITTGATALLRDWTERTFHRLHEKTHWPCLVPYVHFGRYGPSASFRWDWYLAQLVQVTLTPPPPTLPLTTPLTPS